MEYIDEESFTYLYKSLVRPHLEYAVSVWNPYLKKLQTSIENVQRRATKLVPTLKHLNYTSRLNKVKLPTLLYRRYRGDMIKVFKIVNSKYDNDVIVDFLPMMNTNARGNSLEIKKSHSRKELRRNYFTQRIVDQWSLLLEYVVKSKSLNSFKSSLDRIWLDTSVMYDPDIEIKKLTSLGHDSLRLK